MPRKDKAEEVVEALENREVISADRGSAEQVELKDGPPSESEWRKIQDELGRPFAAWHVRVKPGKVSNGQALALWYIDARAVMDRLDAVVGSQNWQFNWYPIPADGHVVIQGSLTVLGITKSDVGEARGEDEPWKSGVSDAFKRTAVQFGIGRFLYRLPQFWWPYNEQSRRLDNQDELYDFVDKVMADLDEVDGDVAQINIRDYSDMIPRDGKRRTPGESSSSQPGAGSTAAPGGDLTPAQEGYIKRLYTQKFGRYQNGNALFANFLKQNIGKVCPIEKLNRSEADAVIKGLQDLASAA